MLCDAVEHACSICGTKGDNGAHRGLFMGGKFAQRWRCTPHLYDRSEDDPKAPARFTASPTFIADPARAVTVTRVVLVIEEKPDAWVIEETADGAYWKAGARSTLPRNKWRLTP